MRWFDVVPESGNCLSLVNGYYDDGRKAAKITGLTPGICKIVLKNLYGDIVSTLYVEVKYRVSVKTAVRGYVNKDMVHEYIDILYGKTHNPSLIAGLNDEGGFQPLFVKNSPTERYGLFGGDTFILSVVMLKEEYDKLFGEVFAAYDRAVKTAEYLDADYDGDPNYVRVVAEFVMTGSGDATVVANGSETFYIGHFGWPSTVAHYDIEIADGGTYTITNIGLDEDGNELPESKTYEAFVADVNHTRIYNKGNNNLSNPDLELESWEYWVNGSDVYDAQFELTSAYWTNEQGQLIDDKTKEVIEGQVAAGERDPAVLLDGDRRHVRHDSVGTVVFDVNIDLFERDAVGNRIKVDTVGEYNLNLDSVLFTMTYQNIKDAFNKCPNHWGLDFTILCCEKRCCY